MTFGWWLIFNINTIWTVTVTTHCPRMKRPEIEVNLQQSTPARRHESAIARSVAASGIL